MISIIICTYNRSQCLKRVLESFFKQEGLDKIEFELIIVDNNSDDDTSSVVKGLRHQSKVRYVFEKKKGLDRARNHGIKYSQGEIVAFIDDDVIVDVHWLHNLQTCFQETNADVVGGRSLLLLEKEEPIWFGAKFRKCLGEVDLGNERKVLSNGNGLFGLNLAIRKSVFPLVGGFNEKLDRCGNQLIAGGETNLLRRISSLNTKIFYDPKVVVNHIINPARLKWDYFVAYARGWGKTIQLLEMRRNRPYQLLRVGNSLLEYIKSIFCLIRNNLSDISLYENKWAKWKVIKQKSYLIARWKFLWE